MPKALAWFLVGLVVIVVVIHRHAGPTGVLVLPDPTTGSQRIDDDPYACTDFRGGYDRATWTGCPDGVRREIVCHPFADTTLCKCLEDGAVRHHFEADHPDVRHATSAGRLARANCESPF